MGSKQKILLVSGDPSMLRPTQMWFETIGGFDVVSTWLASEALVLAETHSPDAVILSIEIPDKDGFEVCRLLKRSSWGADIPIFAWTGYPKSYIQERADRAGFDAIFDKSALREISEGVRNLRPMA